MGILQYPTTLAGEEGVLGATKFMVSTDSLATITTAGYLNNIDLAVYPIRSSDVISCLYLFNQQTGSGTLGIFTVTVSGTGTITLSSWVSAGDVLLPVVNDHFAFFNGTSGQIKDSGITASNSSKGNVASVDKTTVINHIATYSDISGTVSVDPATAINAGSIQAGINGISGHFISFPTTASMGTLDVFATNNAGNFNVSVTNAAMGQNTIISIPNPQTATANFVLNQGLNKMQPGSVIFLNNVNGTEAGGTVTANGQSGVITTSALTAGAGTKYTFTFNNSAIGTSSVINLFWCGGTNTIGNISLRATAGAGVSTVDIFNNSPVDALNGTMFLAYTIF